MVPGIPELVDDLRCARVQAVSDEGEVVLVLADGKQRHIRITREAVPLVRRLIALDDELDGDRRRFAQR